MKTWRTARRLRIALLFGGRSGEHAVSLRSAVSVARGLSSRHEVFPVLIDHQGRWRLQRGEPSAKGGERVFLLSSPDDGGRLRRFPGGEVAAEPDLYFPVLHGTYGEDGTVQGLLELAGVAYVGAGVAASAAGMDKELMKALFAQAGLPQVAYRVLRGRNAPQEAQALRDLGLPVFVKPANLGSSVAVSKVKTSDQFDPALAAAFEYDEKVLVEAAASGREIEIAVTGNLEPVASLPGEIVPDREFYDYDSKYSDTSHTELRIPASLSPELVAQAQELAVRAFKAVAAEGLARVDFFLVASGGRLLINEINTIPGFTSISMFPKLWEASGVPYVELLDILAFLGISRRDRRAGLRTTFRAEIEGESL